MNALNDQLKTLRLSHVAKALEQQQEQLTTYAELDFEERLSFILDSEILNCNQSKIQRLKRQAKLRVDAQPSQLVYKEGRNLNRKQMSELLTGSYLHKHQNILITGPTGAGKTYLGCALASSACDQQQTVRYYRLTRLVDDWGDGKTDSRPCGSPVGSARGPLPKQQHNGHQPVACKGVVQHARQRHCRRCSNGSAGTQ
ncbi:transposase/IS protein [Grimontia marina]|uniref:Transposase/IS protein n=1 Tax=Grimontia marina TaxID=646534 RepID=A0A128FGS0_9GAMM|nr:transposase/IS protein [Grimontia marina]